MEIPWGVFVDTGSKYPGTSSYHLMLEHDHMTNRWRISVIVGGAYLDLRLSIAFWEHLLKARLENTNIIVDDRLLLRWMFLAHDTHQSEVSMACQQL
jgi:hypothetical protein